MTTSRLINVTSDKDYVIPAITLGEYDSVYYTDRGVRINKVKGKIHIGIARKNGEVACLCGQHHKQPKEVWYNPSVKQEPDITCGSCIRVMNSLYYEYIAIMNKLEQRIEEAEFHVVKHRTNSSTSNISAEITPVPRVVGTPVIETPVAYHRDKTLEQRLAMLKELNKYMTSKYHAFKPLYDHSVQLTKFGYSTSFSDVIEDYNRERGNLQLMLDELNKTIATHRR